MNFKPESSETADYTEETETGNTLSIDEFFRQLEAKEKDLDISSSEMVIEIEDGDAGDQDLSDYLQMDVSVAPNKPDAPDAASSSSVAAASTAFAAHEDDSAEPLHKSYEPAANHYFLQTEIKDLREQINRLETERAELFDLARRRQNDFDNYKNRTERERGETFRSQLSNLATQMLPVLDNLNRAMDTADAGTEEKSKDFEQFVEGIVLVSQQLNEILAEMGVTPILAVGEPFDPHFHEAVATDETGEAPPQTVTAELLRGYRIGDKVIRASMVKVAT